MKAKSIDKNARKALSIGLKYDNIDIWIEWHNNEHVHLMKIDDVNCTKQAPHEYTINKRLFDFRRMSRSEHIDAITTGLNNKSKKVAMMLLVILRQWWDASGGQHEHEHSCRNKLTRLHYSMYALLTDGDVCDY